MKIVIIGGVAAGAKAAAKARRLLTGAEINLYTVDTHVSYSSCGLPYYIEDNFEDYRMLLVRSPEEFEEQNIHIHLRNRAIKIIPLSKQVLIEDMNINRVFLIEYDKLIICTGARPFIPPIKNVNLPNVFTLRTIEDGINIKNRIEHSKHVTVVGSGYIGVELLEAFVKQGLKVSLIEYASTMMPVFDDDMSILIKEQLMSISEGRFEILNSELVTELSGDTTGVSEVFTSTGRKIDTDMVVICAGVVPNIEIARDAGIALGETGAIKVDNTMATNFPDIYAAGDCVEENLIITDTKVWMPLGSTANKEGRCAAINACGGSETFKGVLGSAVVRCLSLTMSMTGITEKKALLMGLEPISAVVTKYDKVGYMPNVNNITLKLIANKKTGQLIGGQAIGAGDADKRINTLTSALLAKMTVENFTRNDLTYAPPFSPTIDPLLNAAQILEHKRLKALQEDLKK